MFGGLSASEDAGLSVHPSPSHACGDLRRLMWLFSSPTSRHAPAWHPWDLCVSLNTAILTGRRSDEESKIKIEFHLCKISQHCHLSPSPTPFEGKDPDRQGLGSMWDEVRTPSVPRPSQPGLLLAEEGPREAVDLAGCTRPLHPPRKSGSSCCRLHSARGQVSAYLGRISSLSAASRDRRG